MQQKIHLEEDGDTSRFIEVGVQSSRYLSDNSVNTTKYTLLSFFPVAVFEQFKRGGNLYFLVIGILMTIGFYGSYFNSSVSPWSTILPLAAVVGVSMFQEGLADIARHKSDARTNQHPCLVLNRVGAAAAPTGEAKSVMDGRKVVVEVDDGASENSSVEGGNSSKSSATVAFETAERSNIYAGNIILIRNREMVPADVILISSSSERGSAYIETSSIDGETNLKLRTSPFHSITPTDSSTPEIQTRSHRPPDIETLEQAVHRITRLSALGSPDGVSADTNPNNPVVSLQPPSEKPRRSRAESLRNMLNSFSKTTLPDEMSDSSSSLKDGEKVKYISTIISEPPNPSINTYIGQFVLPPLYNLSSSVRAALGSENILLRGAVLRNTEWAIGVIVFAGKDTKLVQNSIAVPHKFSVLDGLVNKTVGWVILVNLLTVIALSSLATLTNKALFNQDQLWYIGLQGSSGLNGKWPYLPDLESPKWEETAPNYLQLMFLFVTLLSNFVPVSLYITMEMTTFFFIYLINVDVDMYHKDSDTRALARSTNATDLGRIDYVFSDKTGTLTENIMRFKRASVDGLVFGAPVLTTEKTPLENAESKPFHPLRQLLIGGTNFQKKEANDTDPFSLSDGLESFDKANIDEAHSQIQSFFRLTFNAEMFLRVLSICHTVVVEKDYDNFNEPAKESSVAKSWNENSNSNLASKGEDGAPQGYTYQFESPDEGALVSAASLIYGFQLVSRDSSGIRLNRFAPSILDQDKLIDGLKSKKVTPRQLACEVSVPKKQLQNENLSTSHDEVWTILAVNKFDSDRKRMSILVRSPSHMGSFPILFCKGADSAMLDKHVCEGAEFSSEEDEIPPLQQRQTSKENIELSIKEEDSGESAQKDWEFTSLLGLQTHLGDFACEGLRTLVLGMRVLSEDECSTWLSLFESAATAISNRETLLKEAAIDIERGLHIVGATAIEDKLQDGVPDAIANLGKAGLKLWVLTGDKRETAIEIGYSTKVLMPHMQLIEIVDGPKDVVRKATAKAFMRLVKSGKLLHYQRSHLDEISPQNVSQHYSAICLTGKKIFKNFFDTVCRSSSNNLNITNLIERRRNVREVAEKLLRSETFQDEMLLDDNNVDDNNVELAPKVFTRAASASKMIEENPKVFSELEYRSMSIASMTARGLPFTNLPVDEDTLSIESFSPRDDNVNEIFMKGKRTVLERLFAVDRDVRHGRLQKHVNQREGVTGSKSISTEIMPKALIIEGAALLHLLGNPQLEEMLFSVASCCDAVIACRVSPKQKALLVRMVRTYVSPEPVTLAIGDGANDVGMIQEAHVGIGISGKEGQQAVNSSDFAIAQFRYLENLILVHGRWNFMRMTKVVLYSFYKNAVLVGLLATFQCQVLYSGTPLFNQWLTSMLNFVVGFPILFIGFFDQDVDKQYVKANPDVYAPGPDNEYMSRRMMLRWSAITLIHIIVIYVLSIHILTDTGRVTSAFSGLMQGRDPSFPGDGEMDFVTFGTIIYATMITTLGYKVMYETHSIIIGDLFTTRAKKNGTSNIDKWYDQFGWTIFAILILCYGFWMFAVYMYSYVATFSFGKDMFNDVAAHTFHRSSISWLVFLLIPIVACICDVTAKVFASMYFPSQSQIHAEIAKLAKEDMK